MNTTMGLNMCMNIGVNIGVNMGVKIGVNKNEKMVVNRGQEIFIKTLEKHGYKSVYQYDSGLGQIGIFIGWISLTNS